jgi:formyl-CoA transferase
VHGESSYFVWLNRSKESLTLDLKTGRGRHILEQLLARADVFVQNLTPGAAARIGLGTDALRERFPSLIPCSISGYGATGPWAERKAYDLLVQCQTGLVSLTGSPEEPARVGISIADIAGGMYAYSGILTALFTRATTGAVRPVEVSLFEALAEWLGQPAYYTRFTGSQPPRVGTQHATIAPYGVYTCADVEDFLAHPVLAARGRWRDVPIPGGMTVPALLPPADLAGVMPRMGAVPAAGEHTEPLLAELGYSPAEIQDLRAARIL